MNLFELFVKIGVQDEATNKLSGLAKSLGSGLKTAASVGVAAVGAAASGITALTSAAINNYAEYEQLVGGVDTLFKEASGKLQEYAANAYKTSGMSANEYMQNVTGFSAALISSLGGDTEAAAEHAERAMTAISDNANKMGTDMESIVQTYQSLARGNYAMLDNLKIGYGGTKEELERLIKDAASYTDVQKEMGVTVDASSMSFDNIVNAISVVQGKLGIAGATALEAGTTIEGSVNSMKAAWQNLLTGIADDNADFEGLIDNFVTTIAGDGTESNLGVFGNILPRIEVALNGAIKLIDGLFPVVMERFPAIIQDTLPRLAESAFHIVETIVNGALEHAPDLFQLAVDILIMLAEGIADNVSELTSSIVDVILKIVEVLTNPDSLVALTGAALDIIIGIAEGLIKALPQIVRAVPQIIESIVVTIGNLLYKVTQVGQNIVNGIWQGIQNMKAEFTRKIKNFFTGIVDGVKSVLGIHSPSRVFAGIGKFMADGLGEGWEDEFKSIKKGIDDSLEFGDASIGVNASAGMAKTGVTAGGNVINITFNNVQSNNPREFVEYIANELQRMTERRGEVFG